MGSINKVILIGNLGADHEIRYTSGGQAVANLRIATTERFRDKDNQPQEKTEWHRVVVWGKQAESCKQYLSRGRQVYVEGALETREWTDKEGVKRYSTEVKARQIVFLGSREGGGQSGGSWGGGGGQQSSGGGGQRPGGGQGGGWGGSQPRGGAQQGPPVDDGYFPGSPDGISDEDIPF